MIELNHMQKQYPGFQTDISLSVKPGCCTALVGLNGAGKSTVFKSILGLIRPEKGSAKVFDTDAWNLTLAQKQQIAAVFSDSSLNQSLGASEIKAILEALYPSFDREFFDSQIHKQNLPKDKKTADFSTGMLAKLKVIAAIACRPKLMILDEPTAGLDVIARDEILDLLREWMEHPDHALLISSHNAKDIQQLCDDYYLIKNGTIDMHETFDRLLDSFGLIECDAKSAEDLDGRAVLYKENDHGKCRLLCSDRKFYQENYPLLEVVKADLDDVIELANKGTKNPDAFDPVHLNTLVPCDSASLSPFMKGEGNRKGAHA